MSILICYDGSPSAQYALAQAADSISQAAPQHDDVTLLHVWNEPLQAPADSFSYRADPTGPSAERLVDVEQGRAYSRIEEGRALATEHGLAAHTLIASNVSTVAATILRIADEQDSSLIVVGAHQRGTPGPSLESTSGAVIANSSRPVLVIPLAKSVAGGPLATGTAQAPSPTPA